MMGNLIVFIPRLVQAKGASASKAIRQEMLQDYLLDSDAEKVSLVDLQLPLSCSSPTLFYPGCGADIIYLMLFLEKAFPALQKISLVLNDVENNMGMIKTILDDIGITFSEAGKDNIHFYWNSISVNLQFLVGNAFLMDLPAFDIYFERAFRIMKSEDLGYESRIYKRLNGNGILISDSGFVNVTLEKFPVSSELSSYGEMIVGRKRYNSSI